MVTEYLKCGSDTDVVQIIMVSNLKGTYQPIDRGSITVVIRYKRLFIINNTSPLVLSFTLGTDIALRSVLGIPCLLAMSTIADLANGQLVCSELNRESLSQLDPSGKRMPDGTTLEYFSTVVHDGIPSNILTLGYLPLQYTTSDSTIASVFQATYSSYIVVKDCSFQCYVSPELVYHSPQVHSSE